MKSISLSFFKKIDSIEILAKIKNKRKIENVITKLCLLFICKRLLQKNHYNTQELLTGRKYVYNLFALSLEELYPDKNKLQITKELQNLLIFGTYPEVALQSSFQDKQELLQELSSSYIYKDILEFQQIKYSDILVHLLKVLSLQIGSELFYFKKFLFHDLLHHHPTPTT